MHVRARDVTAEVESNLERNRRKQKKLEEKARAQAAKLIDERDRRAVMIEGGMQNSGLALGIIAVQFNADLGMVLIASLWGIWHIVSGMTLATFWRHKDARLGH